MCHLKCQKVIEKRDVNYGPRSVLGNINSISLRKQTFVKKGIGGFFSVCMCVVIAIYAQIFYVRAP